MTLSDLDVQSDGSNTTQALWVDISVGPRIPASGEYFVISPGKPVAESVYPGNPHFAALPIQDLSGKTYASSNRPTEHVRAQNQTQVNPTPSSPYTYEDYYWDQSTGMFTEILKTLQGSPQTLLHVVMDQTNMWQPDNPFLAANAILTFVSAGLVGIVMVGALAVRRRRRR